MAEQREHLAAEGASQMATQAAHQQVAERLENPEFFDKLRDLDADTDEYAWVEDELGPAGAGAHIIGNRGPDYERVVEWSTRAAAERHITEGNPGRLVDEDRRQLAGPSGRDDVEPTPAFATDERRAVRDGYQAVMALRSLAVENTGLKSVSEATAVSKVEKNEQDNSSRRERAANLFK